MSDKNTNNRSKLTLKLSTSVKSTLTLNRKSNNSKIDNRGIEVTIKGRKNNSSSVNESNKNDEIRKRFAAINQDQVDSLDSKEFNLKQRIHDKIEEDKKDTKILQQEQIENIDQESSKEITAEKVDRKSTRLNSSHSSVSRMPSSA